MYQWIDEFSKYFLCLSVYVQFSTVQTCGRISIKFGMCVYFDHSSGLLYIYFFKCELEGSCHKNTHIIAMLSFMDAKVTYLSSSLKKYRFNCRQRNNSIGHVVKYLISSISAKPISLKFYTNIKMMSAQSQDWKYHGSGIIRKETTEQLFAKARTGLHWQRVCNFG